MFTNWIILGIIIVCLIAALIYFFRRNQKDKKEVTRFFNEKTEQESKTNDHDETSEI